MRERKRHVRFLFLTLIVAFILILPTVTLAQDADEDLAPATCNPVLERLAEALKNLECDDLIALLADGHELGQVMQAVYVAGEDATLDNVEELIERKEDDDIGWGQFKIARRLANEDFEFDTLLALRLDDGLGWGQIKKVQALVDLGANTEEAIGWMQQGLGWSEMRSSLGIDEAGPPPWANNDKEKGPGNNNGNGPPPWSNAGGKNNDNGD